MTRRYIQEAARLAPRKNPDGTYRLIVIDEGEGSTGIYSAEMLANEGDTFSNAPSFINHPIDPQRPDARDLNSIAGRVMNTRVELVEGKTAIVGDFKPRNEEVAKLVEEFGDIIGASIFCSAYGEVQENGKLLVESFNADDPYRSVDLVVAAGRGGRFERAAESLRAIESSLGLPQGALPAAESSAAKEKENNMDEKILEAINSLAESLKPVVAFVTESKNAEEKAAQAKVDDQAIETAVDEALESYDEKVKAIEAADLLPSQVEAIRAEARKGADVAPLIESAKKVRDEAVTHLAESGKGGHYVSEGAAESHDFTIPRLKGSF